MTLPTIGTTQGAQSANQSIAATAKADGTITWIGPSGIQGSTITTVVTVPQAPATAIFTATLGTPNGQGVPLNTWGGTSTAGQFQVGVGQTLVVTGTGMAPGTAYQCVFGLITDVGDVQAVLPEPGDSALAVALALVPGVLFGPTLRSVSGGIIILGSVPVTPQTRTLLIELAGTSGVDAAAPANVEVIGATTGIIYYNGPSYLPFQIGSSSVLVVVPIVGVADTSVEIVISQIPGAGPNVLTVWGDSAVYDQSRFYNGQMQAAGVSRAGAGSTVLVSGPCRISALTVAWLSGASVELTYTLPDAGGTSILFQISGATSDGSIAIPFVPAIILGPGPGAGGSPASISLVSGGAPFVSASAIFAYP